MTVEHAAEIAPDVLWFQLYRCSRNEHAIGFDLLRRADAIFIDELRQARDADGKSWYDLTAQAFAVFLPVKSVAVMGESEI